MSTAEAGFRRLTLGDPTIVAALDGSVALALDLPRLDARTESMLRIGALIALDAPESSYRTIVDEVRSSGVGLEDLLAVLISLAGTVGSARIIAAAPKIALAAGYDVESALEWASPPAPLR
jgi:4-carboxymuconolactone decarboxylase